MSQHLEAEFDSSPEQNSTLLAEFGSLWAEAEELWERHQNTPAFHGYVSADYLAVFDSLARLRGSALKVLEWGSGLGIVTIMASRMGFESYGIEAEPHLIKQSEILAQTYGPDARFAQGSFIPDQFRTDPANAGGVYRTIIEAESAYGALAMEISDFDLVYAYPWPDELALYHRIIRKFGRRGSMLLTYDARAGMKLARFNGS